MKKFFLSCIVCLIAVLFSNTTEATFNQGLHNRLISYAQQAGISNYDQTMTLVNALTKLQTRYRNNKTMLKQIALFQDMLKESANRFLAIQCNEAIISYTTLYTKNNTPQGEAIKTGDTVTTHYIGALEDGTVFDTSIEEIAQACGLYTDQRDYRSGLEFSVLSQQMIPGFDNAIVGMKVGEAKRVTIQPGDAYGEHDPKNVQEVPLDQLPPKEDASAYEVGESLFTMYGEFKIASISGDMISVDTNHQLAGKTLYFDIFPLTIDQE